MMNSGALQQQANTATSGTSGAADSVILEEEFDPNYEVIAQ
jgi:hypothetical protein